MTQEDPDYIQSLGPRPKAWLTVALSWVAGYVDVIGWVVLAHIYTSHMSGNTASLGHVAAYGDWRNVVTYGWPILWFLFGLIVGAFIIQIGKRRGFHSTLALILGLEAPLLVLFILLGLLLRTPGDAYPKSGWKDVLLVSLAAGAMGLQTVTLTRVGRLRVYTTFLTGSLSKLAESLAEYGLWVYDQTRGRFFHQIGPVLRATPRQECFQNVVLTAGLWVSFVTGAICGALALPVWGLPSLCAPIAILLLLALVDIARPVSPAHEHAGHFWLHEMLPPGTAILSRSQRPSRANR